jgi:hypothetical protein
MAVLNAVVMVLEANYMKPYKNFLRYWFAITSVLSFVGGWIIFAHSPKPVGQTAGNEANSLAPLPTLAPIQTFGNSNNKNWFGSLFSSGSQNNAQQSSGFPRIRTGGS